MPLPLAAAALVFLATMLAAASLLRRVGTSTDGRIRALAAPSPSAGIDSMPFQERVILPLVDSIGGLMVWLLPGAFLRRTRQRLIQAGEPMKPAAFYTLMFLMGAATATAMILVVLVSAGGAWLVQSFVFGAFAFIPGAYVPAFWLSAQARARKRGIVKGLPDSLDLLTICVEAGLGLDAAFHRVVEKQSGPLVDEFRQMLREIGLGGARKEALLSLAERAGSDDVRSFTLAVIQAEQLGTGLAQVLRTQAERVRVRRRQHAEQDARRAPVKMVFPLVFCLMPSLFIFILGPIIVRLVGFLGAAS